MKKVLLWVGGIFSAIFVLVVIIGIVVMVNVSKEITSPLKDEVPVTAGLEQEKAPEPTKEEAPKNKPTITKAEFDQIENGMTYEQVKEIIGGDGELLSEVGTPGEMFHTVMYTWYGEGMLGANANFTFQNGKLQAKAQIGLK